MTPPGDTARATARQTAGDGTAGAPDGGPAPTGRLRRTLRRAMAGLRVGEDRLPVLLWALGAVLLLTVVCTAVVLPLTRSRTALASAGLIDELPVWSWLAGLPWPVPEGAALAGTLLAVAGCASTAHALAVVACWDRPSSRRTLVAVLVPAVAFLTVSAFALPTQSSDMVDYLLSGRVAAEHGASPYEVAPDTYPDDPLLPYASGTYTADAEQKPPIWIAGAVALAAVAGDDPATAVLVVRLAFLAVTLVNTALVAAVLHRWRPRHLLAGLVLYAWSPVVALHGQAKFDTLMATFVLLAALLLVTGRRWAVLPLLWASVLVKVLTLPLLGAYVLAGAAARRWRRLLVGGALVAVLTLLAYAPFGGRVALLVEHVGFVERGGSSLPGMAGLVVAGVVAGVVAWVGLRSGDDPERMLQGWALVALGVVLLTPIGWAWYLITPLAVVSLSGERWRTVAVIGLSGLAYATDLWTRSSGPLSTLPELSVSRAAAYSLALLAMGLVAVVLVGAHRHRVGRAARSTAR